MSEEKNQDGVSDAGGGAVDYIKRFWSKVDRSGGDESCWNWTGCSWNSFGHGCVWIGRKVMAHRLAFSLLVGDPGSACVLHRCDNPRCVNPRHLFLGTRKDNNKDRDNKRRQCTPFGTKNGNSKLDPDDVRVIRAMFDSGYCGREIKRLFNVTNQNLSLIRNRITWNHV